MSSDTAGAAQAAPASPPSNRESAAMLLGSAALSGTVAMDSTWAAEIAALTGAGYALLDIADAIREQPVHDHGGIRDDLAEIGHALRKIAGT